jgi:hypothetical protein
MRRVLGMTPMLPRRCMGNSWTILCRLSDSCRHHFPLLHGATWLPNPCPQEEGWQTPHRSLRFCAAEGTEWADCLCASSSQMGNASIAGVLQPSEVTPACLRPHGRRDIILLAVWLHQVQCQLVGINQTSAVYQGVENNFQLLGRQFHNMLFPEIERSCCISRYYDGWL